MKKEAELIQDKIISEKYEGKLPDSDIIRKYQKKVIELADPELALFFSEIVDGYDKEAMSQIVINSLEPELDRESFSEDEEVDMSDDLILDDKDLNEPTLDLTDVISQTQEIVLENTNE